MNMKEAFNAQSADSFGKVNDNTLRWRSESIWFDFMTRVVTVSSGDYAVIPFSQFDRELLELAHAKLKEIGGNPVDLPASLYKADEQPFTVPADNAPPKGPIFDQPKNS